MAGGRKLIWFGVVLALAGCAALTVKRSAGPADEAKAKQFLPEAGVARVYVFRNASFLGKDLVAKLIVNDKVVAENRSNQFSVVSLPPGSYQLECMSGNNASPLVSLLHNQKKAPLGVTAEAGKVYFIQQVFKGAGGFSLKLVSAQESEPIIKKASLAETVKL